MASNISVAPTIAPSTTATEKVTATAKQTASTTRTTRTTTALALAQTTCILQRHLLTISKLRDRVRQILKCVINLHIDLLMLDSDVNQITDDVRRLKADLIECERLDDMIRALRDYDGPTIYHEWPFPVVYSGDIEEADLAQTLNQSPPRHNDCPIKLFTINNKNTK